MIWGIIGNKRVRAFPSGRAFCPICKEELIAKCGEIKIWHWAHKSSKECDPWHKEETEWHIKWKENFPKEFQEVKIGKHRADIRTKKGLVIEFQSSSISPSEIKEREAFYKNMVWVLNGKTIAKNFFPFKLRYKWRWFPKSFKTATRDIYIDKGDIFLYKLITVGNEGVFRKVSKIAFIIQHGGSLWKKKK